MRYAARFISLFVLMLLSACQQQEKPQSTNQLPDFAAQCQNQQAKNQRNCQFLREMTWRTRQNFRRSDHDAGLQCEVTIIWDDGHQRYNVLATRGDERVCLKAWQTIGATPDLPPPPPDLKGQLMLNFTPG
ncbi:hypothetical protein BTJ39_18970 [Izhakiella australiensis]|uniref:Colicin transporter n=1 Tax=Izhakiella australiensis TaxID=1926881 RepID=A0A1S8YGG1_9GAMM|nr:hypothetical protein [Izhakiella australiensis]OON38055.1 hypothetical protein BTJ39_18970 [Izhakiella australiensis]